MLIRFLALQGNRQASPLTNLIWFRQMCSLAPARPDQLLISPLPMFIMSESVNKKRVPEITVRIKIGGSVGVSGQHQAYLSRQSWERERDAFIILGISTWDRISGVIFPRHFQTLPLILFFIVVLSISTLCYWLFCQIPSQAVWLECQWISLY